MYQLSTILAASTLLVGIVSAQTTLPSCANNCVTTLLPASCNLDPNCICHTANFLDNIGCCVFKACDTADQSAALAYAHSICDPVSASSLLPASATCTSSASGSATSTVSTTATGAAASASSSASSEASSASSNAPSAASSVSASVSSAASSASVSASSAASSASSPASSAASAGSASAASASATPTGAANQMAVGLGAMGAGMLGLAALL